MVATALLMSFGTTSPRYSIMQAMYFPALGSQTTIWLVGSNPCKKPWEPQACPCRCRRQRRCQLGR